MSKKLFEVRIPFGWRKGDKITVTEIQVEKETEKQLRVSGALSGRTVIRKDELMTASGNSLIFCYEDEVKSAIGKLIKSLETKVKEAEDSISESKDKISQLEELRESV